MATSRSQAMKSFKSTDTTTAVDEFMLRLQHPHKAALHLGAKVHDVASVPIEDPERLLSWLAKDRAMVSLASVEEVRLRKPALQAIVRQWIRFV